MATIHFLGRQLKTPTTVAVEYDQVQQLFFNVLCVHSPLMRSLSTRFAHGNTDLNVHLPEAAIRPSNLLVVPDMRARNGNMLLVQTQPQGGALSERDLLAAWRKLLTMSRFGLMPLLVAAERDNRTRTENNQAGLPLYRVDLNALTEWSSDKKQALQRLIEFRMQWLGRELTKRFQVAPAETGGTGENPVRQAVAQ